MDAAVVASQRWSRDSRGERWKWLESGVFYRASPSAVWLRWGMQERREEAGDLGLSCWNAELLPTRMGKGPRMPSVLTLRQ